MAAVAAAIEPSTKPAGTLNRRKISPTATHPAASASNCHMLRKLVGTGGVKWSMGRNTAPMGTAMVSINMRITWMMTICRESPTPAAAIPRMKDRCPGNELR
ncbi:hypothetical protein D3C72_1870460 [compost metagenome]